MILNVWLCWMTLEGARLHELHISISVACGMSHHEYIHKAVSFSSQFKTKEDTNMTVAVLVMNPQIDARRRSSK